MNVGDRVIAIDGWAKGRTGILVEKEPITIVSFGYYQYGKFDKFYYYLPYLLVVVDEFDEFVVRTRLNLTNPA